MSVINTPQGKFLTATPYEWRQTFKVIVPSGRIKVKTVASVCPIFSNAFQRADGKTAVGLTNSGDTDTNLVVSWFPTNPVDESTAPIECINVGGDAIQIRARSVGYFYIPINGCGNLTIVISKLDQLALSLCTTLTTNDVSLVVNSRDVVAELSPVVSNIQFTQSNIISGIQQAISDLSRNMIDSVSQIVSLLEGSRGATDFSQLLLNAINNAPKINYNANVSVATNFSRSEDLQNKYDQISQEIENQRKEVERIRNQSIEATAQYVTASNNVNVTAFFLALVGDSIVKGLNVSSRYFGLDNPNTIDRNKAVGMAGYSDICKSNGGGNPFGILSNDERFAHIRKTLGFSVPSIPSVSNPLNKVVPSVPSLPGFNTIPDMPGIPGIGQIPGFPSDFIGTSLNGLGGLLGSFSNAMCSLTMASNAAEALAKIGQKGADFAVDAVNSAKAEADKAVDEAKQARDEGFNLFKTGTKGIGDLFENMLSLFYYIIPIIIIVVIVYLVYNFWPESRRRRRYRDQRDEDDEDEETS
jgi:hypothetical protein